MNKVDIKESEPRNAAGTIKGGLHRPKNIGSFGIISIENPNMTIVPKYIKEHHFSVDLEKSLKSGHRAFVRLKGRFGKNDVFSCFIFNIDAPTLSYYAGETGHTSFVHVRFLNDGQLVSEYWVIQNPDQPYHRKRNTFVKIEEVQGYPDMCGQDGNCSVNGKNFKYSFPLGVFESVSDAVDVNLQNVFENRGFVRPSLKMVTEGVGFGAYYNRGAAYRGLYGTINENDCLR